MEKQFKCSICKKTYFGFGNNSEPLAHGRCCDECDTLVIIHRIKLMHERKKEDTLK